MPAGKYRHRITISARVVGAQDAHGQPTITWVTRGTFWASRANQAGREFERARAVAAEVDDVFRVRYQPGIEFAVADKITFGATAYDVTRVDNLEGRNREWVLYAKRTA